MKKAKIKSKGFTLAPNLMTVILVIVVVVLIILAVRNEIIPLATTGSSNFLFTLIQGIFG